MVEHLPFKQVVDGSIPSTLTDFYRGKPICLPLLCVGIDTRSYAFLLTM